MSVSRASVSRDAYVVKTAPLSRLVGGFVSDWARERPSSGGLCGQRSQDALRPISAMSYLIEQSGLSRDTIRRVLDERTETTELRIAEPLVMGALELPNAFHDGTLRVYHAREIAAERRERQSLTGVG